MPNSGTVTAGSAALASQYNNLRADVLNTSSGHTHTGASENGAQIEGTVIKSTGATNGQVLTANGAGGATFTTLAGAGQFSLISGTAAYSTATNGGTPFFYTSGPTGNQWHATTGGGTVIIHNLTAAYTSTITFYRRALDSDTIVASTALAPATAGTTYATPHGYGFNAGTAFIVMERGRTSNTVTHTIRKLNVAMTSVMWSTTLLTGTSTNASYDSYGPLWYGQGGVRYASGPGIWYGGDYRTYAEAAGTMQIANVWVINDVSGSAYSAAFGSAAGTANSFDDVNVQGCVFVPSSTAATNGTIHAWGNVAGTPRYVSYSVGSASISAIATANGVYTGRGQMDEIAVSVYPSPLQAIKFPYTGVWLSSAQKILVTSSRAFYLFDRTFGTLEYSSQVSVGNWAPYFGYTNNLDAGAFDETTMYGANVSDGNVWGRFGAADGLFASFSSAFYATTTLIQSRVTLAGNGSATHFFGAVSNTGGTSVSYQLAGLAKVPFGTTSATKRTMTITNPRAAYIVAIDAGGSGQLISASPGTADLYARSPISFVAGTGQPYVYVRQDLSSQSSQPPKKLTEAANGGTAIVSGYQVTLG